MLPLFLLAACGAPSNDGVRQAAAGAGNSGPTDSGRADDTAGADTGLVWSGGLAVYDGCTSGDPGAKLLAEEAPPESVTAGSTVTGAFIFANCEDSTWIVATAADAGLGVKLGAVSDTVAAEWGAPRVVLPVDVPPGHAVRVPITGVAPLSNGPHPWRWQLVDEWVRWIGEATPTRSVEVVGGQGPFTVHPREEWQTSSQPVEGPDMDLTWLEFITIHYNGVAEDLDGDDDVYTDADAIDRIRNVQEYSLATNDGVSAGYNSYISHDGDEWEIRGHDIRNAASGCPEANYPGYTINIPTTDPDAAPTVAQIEGAKAAIQRIRAAAATAGNPTFLTLNGHRDVAPLCGQGTSCPGEPLYALLQDGELEP